MKPDGPRPRKALENMPKYVPGASPSRRGSHTAYKLSSNENPFPPLDCVLDAVAKAALDLNRYPDLGNADLRHAIAEDLGVAAEQVAPATGSVAVLYHLLTAFCEPGDEVVHAWRSFEAYPIGIALAGAEAISVPLNLAGEHDLEAMLAAITERSKVILLCSPNNPTGPALRHSDVAWFVAQVPSHVMVVLDEAYQDFVRSTDPLRGLELVAANPNVVTVRTFAKAAGLAGLRVGYLVGSVEIAIAVRTCALPFGISGIAQAAAIATLGAGAELADRVEVVVRERARVLSELVNEGWSPPDAQGNFVWVHLGTLTSQFAEFAEAAGISVRPFGDDGVRVTIGEPAANDAILSVLSEWRRNRELRDRF